MIPRLRTRSFLVEHWNKASGLGWDGLTLCDNGMGDIVLGWMV